MFAIIENPFAGWAFYVVHVTTGRIVGFSNSYEWCESAIRTCS